MDKPWPASALAASAVLGAKECIELLSVCAGEHSFPVSLRIDDLSAWFELYCNHRRVIAALEPLIEPDEELLKSPRTEDAIRRFLVGDMDITDATSTGDEFWRKAFSHVEMLFFFRVVAPFAIAYGKVPAHFLANVGRGGEAEHDSLEKLVAIDPIVIQHPRIVRWLNCDNLLEARRRAKVLGTCLGESAPTLENTNVKSVLAGQMSVVSERLGCRFLEPDIRSLFDAIARDRGLGLRDKDLPASQEAFSKAIWRCRKLWQWIQEPDEDLLFHVRALGETGT